MELSGFILKRYSPLSFVSFEIYNGFSLVRWMQTIKGQLFRWAEVSNVLYISLKYFFQIQVVYGYSPSSRANQFQMDGRDSIITIITINKMKI